MAREELERLYRGNADLRTLNLRDGAFDRIVLPKARLDGADLRRANFQAADLSGASLMGVEAVRASFTQAKLAGADLRGADLTDASLLSADLTAADLRGVSFSPYSNLKGAKVGGAKIDRQALRRLGPLRGGLTDGDIASMEVHDDLVKLTTGFGGFWSTLHLLAASIFLLPYLAFLVRRYIEAQLLPCTDCVPLRETLWQYIVTGGRAGGTDCFALVIFGLLLAYNIFRTSLVYKAQSLRLAEAASGIAKVYVLDGYWRIAYYGCQVLVWFNLALVLLHAYQFLDTPVSR